MKLFLNSVFKIVFFTFVVSLVSLFILEIIYRNQWIDFYRHELNALNPESETQKRKHRILVFGDSFSAQQNSYVQILKDSLPNFEVINCAIPGTSMREMSLIAQQRIKEFSPDKIILQLYPGNDLIDISHPYNSTRISLARNLYWIISDRFYSLAWLNYKLGAIRTRLDSEQKFVVPSERATFSVSGYNGRVKLLLRAEPDFIENSLQLKGEDYKEAFDKMKNFIAKIVALGSATNPQMDFILLYIPHCTEVNDIYRKNYIRLGAQLQSQSNSQSGFYYNLKQAFPACKIFSGLSSLQLKEDASNSVYFSNDEHLNKEGQKEIGNMMINLFK